MKKQSKALTKGKKVWVNLAGGAYKGKIVSEIDRSWVVVRIKVGFLAYSTQPAHKKFLKIRENKKCKKNPKKSK